MRAGDLDSDERVIGRVAEVWRYPVKSLGGERLERVLCEHRGLRGDRRWAVVALDGRIGSGKTTRRFRRMPGLLGLTGHTDEAGDVWVERPDGRRARAGTPDAAAWLREVTGQTVSMGEESGVSHFDDAPVHLVTTSALDGLRSLGLAGSATDRRRFRPNLVIVTSCDLVPPLRLRVGTATVLSLTKETVRCVMTAMAQPGLALTPGILKRLEQERDGCFGVYATVEAEGEVAVEDPVTVIG